MTIVEAGDLNLRLETSQSDDGVIHALSPGTVFKIR